MDTQDILQDIRDDILKEIREKYKHESVAVRRDVDIFIEESKEKILRWTVLLENRQLTIAEYELLMYSQKDLFVMKTLYKAGVSAISLGHFKNKIIRIILSRVISLLLP